jgi:hypothetical protein
MGKASQIYFEYILPTLVLQIGILAAPGTLAATYHALSHGIHDCDCNTY